jgi:hypothetical protein
MMFTLDQHWQQFADFCRYETAYGGPDPHMTLSAEMSRGQELHEAIWRGGCYVAVYSAPYGEVIWQAWPWERIKNASAEEVRAWLDDNWKRLEVHRHRKTVRRADWMTEYLLSYRAMVPRLIALLCNPKYPLSSVPAQYDAVWDEILSVKRLGRYVGLKLMEFLRRVDLPVPPAHDLRPVDGWSPRQTLAMLLPEYADIAEKKNHKSLLVRTEEAGDIAQQRLTEYGVNISRFELQVMLCEYKQASKGKQHPGRAADTEMRLAYRVQEEWPDLQSDIWRARKAILQPWALGELHEWRSNRNDLKTVLLRHGYTWSDSLYDFDATTDFANPVKRLEVAA